MARIVSKTILGDVETFTGRPAEISGRINKLKRDRVFVIATDEMSPSDSHALQNMLLGATKLFRQAADDQLDEKLQFLVKAFLPKAPPTPIMLKEAEMQARAQTAVFASADWLTAPQVATLAGFSDSNLSAQPTKWKREGRIFTVPQSGTDYFPGYGLDPDNGYRPLKSLKSVLDVFKGRKKGWGLGYWFSSVNSFLGGRRPQDVLKVDPDRVVAAAKDELTSIGHG